MIVELRQKSQVTIPSELIKQLSLNPGDKFEAVVKDGVLLFIPVAIYPKEYVNNLEKEISDLKDKIHSGKTQVYHNVEDMISSLDENNTK